MLHLCLWMFFLFILASHLHFTGAATAQRVCQKNKKMCFDSPQSIVNTQWKWKRCDVAHNKHLLKVYSDLWLMRPFTLNVCLQTYTPCQIFHQKLLPPVFSLCVFVSMYEMQSTHSKEWQNIGIDLNALAKCQRPQFNEDTNFFRFIFISFFRRGRRCVFIWTVCGFSVR